MKPTARCAIIDRNPFHSPALISACARAWTYHSIYKYGFNQGKTTPLFAAGKHFAFRHKKGSRQNKSAAKKRKTFHRNRQVVCSSRRTKQHRTHIHSQIHTVIQSKPGRSIGRFETTKIEATGHGHKR